MQPLHREKSAVHHNLRPIDVLAHRRTKPQRSASNVVGLAQILGGKAEIVGEASLDDGEVELLERRKPHLLSTWCADAARQDGIDSPATPPKVFDEPTAQRENTGFAHGVERHVVGHTFEGFNGADIDDSTWRCAASNHFLTHGEHCPSVNLHRFVEGCVVDISELDWRKNTGVIDENIWRWSDIMPQRGDSVVVGEVNNMRRDGSVKLLTQLGSGLLQCVGIAINELEGSTSLGIAPCDRLADAHRGTSDEHRLVCQLQ